MGLPPASHPDAMGWGGEDIESEGRRYGKISTGTNTFHPWALNGCRSRGDVGGTTHERRRGLPRPERRCSPLPCSLDLPSSGGMDGEEILPGDGGGQSLVILFYHYGATDVGEEVREQEGKCRRLGLLGRVLVSEEGLNGTLAGCDSAVEAYEEWLVGRREGVALDDFKRSRHGGAPSSLFPDLQAR